MAVAFNYEKPLAVVKGESPEANTALRDYALMGDGRSLAKLHAHYLERAQEQARGQSEGKTGARRTPGRPGSGLPPTTRLNTLERWSARFGWQARLQVWKELLDAQEEEKWRKRRAQLREDEWEHGSELLGLAKNIMAETPKFIRTTRRVLSDKREIITMALDGHLLVKITETGSKLRRQAAEMETELFKVNDWHSTVVDMLKKKLITPEQVREDFAEDADELLRAAGVAPQSVHPGKRSLQESEGAEEG